MRIISSITLILSIEFFCCCTPHTRQYKQTINSDYLIEKVELNEEAVNDFAKICKCWGFVKYYYPNLDKSGIDINKELFYIIDDYMDSKDVDKTISNWIDTLKHYSKPVHKQINPKNIVYYTSCDLSWIKDRSYCNSSLAERLSWILSLRRWKGNYCNNGIVINHISMNADSSLCDYKSIKQRLLLLFNYWNVIEYYYCLKQNNLNWDNILKEYLPLFVCSEGREIIPLFRSLSSHLHDSHGITIVANDSIPSFIPLNARMEDTLLVAIGETEEYIPNNSIIMAIDGREPKVLLKEYRDSLHSNYSTEAALLSSFISDGLRSNKDSCAIIFSYQGIVDSVTIPTLFPYEYRDWYITNRTARIPDIDLFDGICYINAGAYKRANCDFYYQKIQQAETVVFDMRFYPENSLMPFIYKFFMPQKGQFAQLIIPRWEEPGSIRVVKAKYKQSKTYYSGKIVVVVDENTKSQGEYITMALQANPNTITVGTATSGSDGNMAFVDLPGGIRAYYTGMGVIYPDGTPTQRVGVKVDYYLKKSTVDSIYYEPKKLVQYVKSIIN